jgi:hypothetical protein
MQNSINFFVGDFPQFFEIQKVICLASELIEFKRNKIDQDLETYIAIQKAILKLRKNWHE